MLSFKQWKTLNESIIGLHTLGVRSPNSVGITGSVFTPEELEVLEEMKKKNAAKKKKMDGELLDKPAEPKDADPEVGEEEPEEKPLKKKVKPEEEPDEEPAEEPEEGEEEEEGGEEEAVEKKPAPEAPEEDPDEDAGEAGEMFCKKCGDGKKCKCMKADAKKDKKEKKGDDKEDKKSAFLKKFKKGKKDEKKDEKKEEKKEKTTKEEDEFFSSLNTMFAIPGKGWDGFTPIETPQEGEGELVNGSEE